MFNVYKISTKSHWDQLTAPGTQLANDLAQN